MVRTKARVGTYRLEAPLGRGGLAEVWLARSAGGEAVALKRPLDGLGTSAIEALNRERSVGRRLSHPGIVSLIDSGGTESRPFVVFEYVDGPSLRERLAEGPLSEAETVEIGGALLAALAHAHERGVVHNDLKPENILLGRDGPKIADFGAAQSLTETLTTEHARELAATIAYLAPEVLEGAEPSPASDIYSLGLTLYEAVAGRLPFSGSAALIAGQRVAVGVPPLRSLVPAASPQLERALARALEPDPALRFASAATFAAALSPVYQPTVVLRPAGPAREPIAAAPAVAVAPRASRTRSLVLASLGALALLGGAVGLAASRGGDDQPAGSDRVFDANARLALNTEAPTPAPAVATQPAAGDTVPAADTGPRREPDARDQLSPGERKPDDKKEDEKKDEDDDKEREKPDEKKKDD